MIDGMRMDLVKSRYHSYDELYEYCYKVAGTVALMSVPVMGVDPKYKVRRRDRVSRGDGRGDDCESVGGRRGGEREAPGRARGRGVGGDVQGLRLNGTWIAAWQVGLWQPCLDPPPSP